MLFKGAIVMGYQGIGKSTLVEVHKHAIDLESSLFKINGERPEHWSEIYCNQAIALASQNKLVLISSHDAVQKEFAKYCMNEFSDIWVGAIAPWYSLKEKWIKKLMDRYYMTGSKKDYAAWKSAECGFHDQITKLAANTAFPTIFIYDIMYDLSGILDNVCRLAHIQF